MSGQSMEKQRQADKEGTYLICRLQLLPEHQRAVRLLYKLTVVLRDSQREMIIRELPMDANQGN
jgi:hypothetical protein